MLFFLDKVTKEKAALFEDVSSSFSSVKEILSRFELWKFGFSESYKDAYMGICIPKLLAPFVKLELLLWNPLEVIFFQQNVSMLSSTLSLPVTCHAGDTKPSFFPSYSPWG